ncbi:MAG: dTDP-4-dehydrorhamnose reductase [Bacteroidales bacterium]|nr:dTDP-4-dehydrorhamnose reductase [Bacteroidales bacterium]
MKILVTGANGQLGTEIRMIAKYDEVNDFSYVDVDNFDMTNAFDVAKWFANQGPFDVVINCAAYTAVDKAETEIKTAKLVNSVAVSILGDICRKMNARMIHISTDYVFDGQNYRPYQEDDLVNPASAYGQSKLEGELAMIQGEVPGIILRTSWLYSPYGANFVKTMLRFGKERESLNVVFDQIGSPTYAHDLAEAILQIIHHPSFQTTNWKGEIFHYSNEGVCSWYDFALEIMEKSHLSCQINPIRSEEYPLPAARPHYSVLDKKKIKSTFGIHIPHWKVSLAVCLEELKQIS